MSYWTVHLRARQPAPPVLLREGFSWAALLFGPLWLLAQRAWIPAVLVIALNVLIAALAPGGVQPLLFLAAAVLVGFSGNDFLRFSLQRRGYALVHVVAGRDGEAALARLLAGRPELAGALADGLAP